MLKLITELRVLGDIVNVELQTLSEVKQKGPTIWQRITLDQIFAISNSFVDEYTYLEADLITVIRYLNNIE